LCLVLFPKVDEVRSRIENIKDEKCRNAFKYLYLVAGRVSEVCGQYSPYPRNVIRCDFEGEKAVLFAVRTARRKRNLYRPVTLPLEYEPWVSDVAEYIEKTPDNEHPFIFPKKMPYKYKSNIRYLQLEASKVFDGLEWTIPEYMITKEKMTEDDNILANVVFELQNRGQLSFDYIPPKTESIVIEQHTKNFTSDPLRYMRAIELLSKYKFNPIELSIYGGWKSSTVSTGIPSFLDRYFGLDTVEPNINYLKMMAEIYFRKLLVR
jgi:hypothetical protein